MLDAEDQNRFSQDRRAPGKALEMIAAERAYQLSQGYSAEHDDAQRNGELAAAAACFVIGSCDLVDRAGGSEKPLWPPAWPKEIVDKRTRIKQLVIAGALIAAEIEREQRALLKELSPSNTSLNGIVF